MIFPDDFMFQLSASEWENMSSQFVMTYPTKRPKNALPLAFTEHGVTMLANILKSKKARQTSISVVRAFIAPQAVCPQLHRSLGQAKGTGNQV